MKRNSLSTLVNWKENDNRKPLLLTGIRGVGKTYLATDFGKAYYDEVVYLNFERNASVRSFFETSVYESDIDSIYDILSNYTGVNADLLDDILFIFDEVSFCHEAVSYISETGETNLNIIAITSNRGTILSELENFDEVRIFPMGFDEFLDAMNSEWYCEVIRAHYMTMKKVPDIVHEELLSLFTEYLSTGGMPAVINEYIKSPNSVSNINEIQSNSLASIISHFSERFDETDSFKAKQIIDSLIEQFTKENHKFRFNTIRKGVTYNMYKDTIEDLSNDGVIYTATRSDNDTVKKIYPYDLGILQMMINGSNLYLSANEKTVLKAYYENCAIAAFCAKGYDVTFWESQSAAKIDFIINSKDGRIPIEIMTDEYRRSKSGAVYSKEFNPKYQIRLSTRNFEERNGTKNIPYYALFCI